MTDTLSISTPEATATLSITDGTIRASELKRIPTPLGPLATYDPGFTKTASVKSCLLYTSPRPRHRTRSRLTPSARK